MLSLILLILAFLLFLIAALLVPPSPPSEAWRGRLALFGFAAWVLAEIVLRTVTANGGRLVP